MKPLTESLKEKVRMYIKNNKDVSELIKGVSIRGMDLSHAKLSDFNRVNDDLSGCNFSYAQIGEAGKITNLCGAIMKNCNFYRASLLGTTWFRRATATNCNFTSCDLSRLDYAYCDFRDSTFCHCIIKIGSMEGMKARFSKTFFDSLVKFWNVEGMENEQK